MHILNHFPVEDTRLCDICFLHPQRPLSLKLPAVCLCLPRCSVLILIGPYRSPEAFPDRELRRSRTGLKEEDEEEEKVCLSSSEPWIIGRIFIDILKLQAWQLQILAVAGKRRQYHVTRVRGVHVGADQRRRGNSGAAVRLEGLQTQIKGIDQLSDAAEDQREQMKDRSFCEHFVPQWTRSKHKQ